MKRILLLLIYFVLQINQTIAQNHVVKGKVTDENDKPIYGASIKVKGSNLGTTSDNNGNYSIDVERGKVLVFSSIGFDQANFKVEGTNLNVTLKSSVSTLSEFVVTALGIKKESRSLGYSTATISASTINIAKPVNAIQGLMGEVSGTQVSIINNGVDPQIRVQLRGERHIISDNQPLYILDGMEVTSDFIGTVNPEDLEDVSVLKSASAAALYGSEASNGVIIFTTKRGAKNNRLSVNFSQTSSATRVAYLPSLQRQFGGYGGEAGVFFPGTPYQFNAINPYTGFYNYIPFENQSYGPEFNGAPSFIGIPNANGQVDSVPYAPQSKNVVEQFMVTGLSNQSNLSINTGDGKNSHFVGLQYVKVNGTVPNDQSQRTSVRFAGKSTRGILTFDYSASYSNKYSNTAGNDITAGWPIYWTLLNTPANIPLSALKDWQDPNSWGNLNNYYNAYYINPYWQIANSRNITKQDNVFGVLNLDLKPTSWMNFSYRVSAQVTNNIYEGYRNAANFTPWAINAYGPPIYGTPSSGDIAGALVNQTTLAKRLQQDIMATFNHNFGKDLSAQLILGNTIWDRSGNTQLQWVGNDVGSINGVLLISGNPQSQTSGLTLPNLYNISYSYGIPNVGNAVSDTRLIGYYADLTFDYKDFLYLHGNYRVDRSSLLAPGNNSYSVYGVDASTIFSDYIPALKESRVISYGKLRAAYSHTGQITLNPYSTVNTFNVASGYPYGGLAALSLSSLYNNPANVPEATNEVEAGIEMGFFRDKITTGITYYHDNNYNQLFPVSLTTATGYSSANVNAANTVSEGWEFDLKGKILKRNNFTFEMGTNLAIQNTTVISLYGTGANKTLQTNIGNANYAIVGMSFPQLYVSDLVRDPANGKVIVNASTGLPSLSNTMVAAGRTTPKYIWGLTPTLKYQSFTLQIVADYRGGYVFYNNAEQNLDFTGATTHTTSNGRQNFIYPNSEIQVNGKYVPNTNVYTADGGLGFWVSSPYRSAGTSYVENAAAWKVRTISLSYDFNKILGGQKLIKGAKLTAICNNVFMFRPKENNFTDPEFNYSNSNGLGYNTYYQLPPTRQFTLSANLNF